MESLREAQAMREDKYTLALKKASAQVQIKKRNKWRIFFVVCGCIFFIVNLAGFLAFKAYLFKDEGKRKTVRSNTQMLKKPAAKNKKPPVKKVLAPTLNSKK